MLSGARAPLGSGGWRYAQFASDEYLRNYKYYLETEDFNSISSNCDRHSVGSDKNRDEAAE